MSPENRNADVVALIGIATIIAPDGGKIHSRILAKSLLNSLRTSIRPPLQLAQWSDGKIVCVTQSDDRKEIRAQLLALFDEFALAREELVQSRLCRCNACQRAGEFRLKVVTHHGLVVTRTGRRKGHVSGSGIDFLDQLTISSVPADEFLLLTPDANDFLGDFVETPLEAIPQVLANGDPLVCHVGMFVTPELAPIHVGWWRKIMGYWRLQRRAFSTSIGLR